MSSINVQRVSRPRFFKAFGGARAQSWDSQGLQGSILAPLGLHFGGFGSLLGTLEALESTRLSSDRPELNFGSILDSFWDHFGGQT